MKRLSFGPELKFQKHICVFDMTCSETINQIHDENGTRNKPNMMQMTK